jgi:hypothetical protein
LEISLLAKRRPSRLTAKIAKSAKKLKNFASLALFAVQFKESLRRPLQGLISIGMKGLARF